MLRPFRGCTIYETELDIAKRTDIEHLMIKHGVHKSYMIQQQSRNGEVYTPISRHSGMTQVYIFSEVEDSVCYQNGFMTA